MAMKRNNEKGTAMLFAIILVLVLSVMAASMMFLSQSETWGSANYRMMTQARYGAEAGVHAAANFLIYSYAPPASMAGYNMVVPVPASCGDTPCVTDGAGNPIILSSLSDVPANYPDGAQQTAFSNATNSSVTAGGPTVNYTAAATLLSQVQITPYGSTAPVMVQTWKITAHGDITNARSAEAEVSAILETPKTPAFGYAAFAKNKGCAALSFTGNGTTNSYDSGALPLSGGVASFPTGFTFNNYGGNVGTNGNQTDSGSGVVINGTLSTPDVTVGTCSAGNVTAFTGSSTEVTGGIIQMPAPFSPAAPTIPAPGTTDVTITNTSQTLAPGNYGNISLSGAGNNGSGTGNGNANNNVTILTLTPGTYNINSISESGQAVIAIGPDPNTGLYGPVIINVTGTGQTIPIDISGQGLSNPTLDPSLLQFNYAGTGQINIVGQGASAAVIYAPNATASFKGNGNFYGSVIAANITDVGNGAIHYDLKLKKKLYVVGNPTLNSFTWSKF